MLKKSDVIGAIWKKKNGKNLIIGGSFFLIISLVFFYSFIYNDIIETMRMGMDVWYSMFDGQLNYFYSQKNSC